MPTVAIKAARLSTRAVMNPKTKRLNGPALTAVSHGIGRAVDERVLDPEIVQMGKAF